MVSNKLTLYIWIIAVSFATTSITASLYTIHTFAQNITESDTPQELPTGQDSVTVETPQGQVVQAAPADAIVSLINTLVATTIPGIIALGLAILNSVRGRSSNSKLNDGIETAIAAFKYADTLNKKIADNYVSNGVAKTVLEVGINNLPQEQQAALQKETNKIPEAQGKLEALNAQVQKLTAALPARTKAAAIADNDPTLAKLDPTV